VTKILGGDFHSIFPLIKDTNSLSSYIFHDRLATHDDERWWAIAATPHTCDNLKRNFAKRKDARIVSQKKKNTLG
jgi:hypothetical protein